MGAPSYDDETLAAYFQPLGEALFDDPVVGPALRLLRDRDPDVLAAVADVDRSQIRDALARTPEEHLAWAVGRWNGLMRLRRGG